MVLRTQGDALGWLGTSRWGCITMRDSAPVAEWRVNAPAGDPPIEIAGVGELTQRCGGAARRLAFWYNESRLARCRPLNVGPLPRIGRVMQGGCEIVHTVTDYYDGPRGGIADFDGRPHAYKSLWDDSEDDWSDGFLLQPVDDETFRLAMEDWDIWSRWERAFHSGETTIETHPALPADRQRHDQIAAILKHRLRIEPDGAIRVRGKFTVRAPCGSGITSTAQWVVSWLQHENAG